MASPGVFDEDDFTFKHGNAIANPGTISVTYSQAEVAALRTALINVLAVLRSANIIALD